MFTLNKVRKWQLIRFIMASLGDYASGLSEAIATYQSMHHGGGASFLFS